MRWSLISPSTGLASLVRSANGIRPGLPSDDAGLERRPGSPPNGPAVVGHRTVGRLLNRPVASPFEPGIAPTPPWADAEIAATTIATDERWSEEREEASSGRTIAAIGHLGVLGR